MNTSGAVKRGAPRELESVTIRFAGDSGDGMQLVGAQFMRASAMEGNDLSTLPDFPAEIRAPAGTVAGVSGYQIQLGARRIFTPGDAPDVLVAMNPAALKSNLGDLKRNGTIIINADAFTEKGLQTAGYAANPLTDGSLAGYLVHKIDIGRLTALALEGLGMSPKDVARCKNYFALGLMFWTYNRDMEHEKDVIRKKFGKKDQVLVDANIRALQAGYDFGETAELFERFEIPRAANIRPGNYRQVTGNQAAAIGLMAAAKLADLRLFLGSYPITPASEILHELSSYKHFGAITFQAEDEIAGVTSCIGAAFGGALAATNTSGPGLALKSEGISLAAMLELPLVVINVQRGGPSTGLPTKTEQSDLLFAMYGRHGECPLPIVSASTPADCFDAALEAARIALKYMTPVIMLSDGYLAQGAEPWRIPDMDALPKMVTCRKTEAPAEGKFLPYERDPATLARPWAIPGTPGLEHRIGGLEKDFKTGNISYDAANHQKMTDTRAAKIKGIANDIAPVKIDGPEQGELLVLGWGSTYGFIAQAIEEARAKGITVSQAHLRHLNPFPANLGKVLKSFKKVLIPEMNLGQLNHLLRAEYFLDAVSLTKMRGQPFKVNEIVAKIEELAH